MKTVLALLCAAALAAPATAQSLPPLAADDTPAISLRLVFVVSGERFSAHDTFNAVFGQSLEWLWGGGLQLAFKNGMYVDVTASRFNKTGQRAFVFNGEGFPLGIPLTATLTPIEFTVGRQFTAASRRLVPYVGGGVGSYGYSETLDSTDAADQLDAHHVGYLVVGGAEMRLNRWLAVSGDLQYTRVPGILGNGGVSKEAGESDLGGIAGRFRVIVGR